MKKPYGVVYVAICMDTLKRYIGQTTVGLEARWKDHCWSANRGSRLALARAIRKYGPERFVVLKITDVRNKTALDGLEKYYIKFFDTTNSRHGYNLTRGGDGIVGTTALYKRRAKTLRKFNE